MIPTVAVDFDGTLHPYSKGWTGSAPDVEVPIEGAKRFLHELVEAGYHVVVFSCRADHPEGRDGIWNWLREHGLAKYVHDVTHIKPHADAYIDDRAVPFTGTWDGVLDHVKRLSIPKVRS